jgi:hypothetical protein
MLYPILRDSARQRLKHLTGAFGEGPNRITYTSMNCKETENNEQKSR